MVASPDKTDPHGSFRKVQNLRNTSDVVIVARACCAANAEVVHKLRTSRYTSWKGNDEIESREASLRDYVSSADSLRDRVRNAIDLV
jgi:hypothetical protein